MVRLCAYVCVCVYMYVLVPNTVMYSFIFVLQYQNAPKLLKIAFKFPLQIDLIQCLQLSQFCKENMA